MREWRMGRLYVYLKANAQAEMGTGQIATAQKLSFRYCVMVTLIDGASLWINPFLSKYDKV